MIDPMTTTSFALFLIALAGSFLQTNIGFGFPVLAMIFLPSLFPFPTAVAICQVVAFASTAYLTIRYREHISWSTMLPLLVISLATGALVTIFSWSIAQRSLEMLLGGLLVLISIFSIASKESLRIRPTIGNGAAFGLIAGFGNGLFGIGGPPVAIYLMGGLPTKEAYLATIQCYFLLSNASTIGLRLAHGEVQSRHMLPILCGWAGIALGTFTGLKFFRSLSKQNLRIAVHAFVGISGLVIIAKHLS